VTGLNNSPRVKLNDLCHVVTKGTTPTSLGFSFSESGIPFLRIQNLRNKTVSLDGVLFINENTHKALKRSIIKPKDFLITIAGTIGRIAIVPDDFPECNCNQAIAILRFDNTKLNPQYLMHWLHTNDAITQINGKKVTATIPNLSLGQIKKLEISLPPLAEQQQIADILDAADSLRQKDQQLVEHYTQLSQSLFLEMFGDTYVNPKKWEIAKVENIASKEKYGIKAGPFGSSLKKEFYVANGYKIYGQEQVIKDDFNYGDYYISTEKFKELESCKVEAGDVLISLVGTYGKVSVVPDEFEKGIINPRLMKISPNKVLIRPDFLKTLLQSQGVEVQLKNFSRGGTMDIINVGIIKKVKIPLPPIDLQNQFAEHEEKIEQQKKQAQANLEKSNQLFNALLQKAFTGELTASKAA
jgi:type I restriction enzyme, S subunit